MEIIAISNIKGGVGRTTTAVNLAYVSAEAGWRTLIWDLDPQAGAIYALGSDAALDGGAKALVRGDTDLEATPLPAFAPRSAAAQLYAALWAEVDDRLQRARG